jgi:hypothetical protein
MKLIASRGATPKESITHDGISYWPAEAVRKFIMPRFPDEATHLLREMELFKICRKRARENLGRSGSGETRLKSARFSARSECDGSVN